MAAPSAATSTTAAAAPRAPSAPDTRPTPAELAPIIIPVAPGKKSDFALLLNTTCNKLLGNASVKSAANKFDASAMAVKPMDATIAASPELAGLKATCDALAGKRPITKGDIDNIRAFRDSPDPLQLANRIFAALNPNAQAAGPVTEASSVGDVLGTVIDGLSKFIYDRAKAEAGLYLAQQLKNQLCSDDRKPFFAYLCVAFDNVDFGVSLSAVGSFMAAAARQDLEQFPDTALVYATHAVEEKATRPKKVEQRDAALGFLFAARLGFAYYREVAAGRSPLDTVRGLHLVKLAKESNPAPQTFKAIQLPSQLIDAIAQQTSWNADVTSWTPQQARCYAVAVALKLDDLRVADGEKPLDLSSPTELSAFSRVLADIPQLIVDLKTVVDRFVEIDGALKASGQSNGGGDFLPKDGTTPKGSTASPGGYTTRDYVVTVTQLLQQLAADGQILASDLGLPTTSLQALATTARLGELIATRQSIGDTALALVGLLSDVDRELRELGVARSPLMAKIEQILPFVAQLAQAKSADEVANVIQAAAVPVTTYQLKSKRPYVAINALVGVYAGAEAVSIGKTSWGKVVGPFAPIGINATTPTSFGHIGGYLSVLNLGSLVAARFDKDTGPAESDGAQTTVGTSPKVDFTNVICPGLFLTLGFGSSPFMVGAGAQIVPARQIAKVAMDGTKTDDSVPAVQALGFASVDVPLFGL